jgi:superfamily I DNA/RNA helicase
VLEAQRTANHPIVSVGTDNPYREADYILDQINRYVGGTESLTTGTHTDSEYSYGFGDIAILFRTNSVGEALFKSLLKSGIPVHFGDGASFLNEPPFTIVGDLLRLVQQPDDHLILSNILKEAYEWNQKQITSLLRSLTKSQRSLFSEAIKETISQTLCDDLTDLSRIYKKAVALTESNPRLLDAVTTICDHFIEDEKLSKSQQLKKETLLELAAESEGEISRFLEQLQLNPYTDVGRLKKQAVHLLTFHAAKGLEFPVVFIAAAEEGVTPILREDTDIEEERRLFYVAMTRAENELQIIHSRERWRFGAKESMQPSRFIDEISEDYITQKASSLKESSDGKQNEEEQLGLF